MERDRQQFSARIYRFPARRRAGPDPVMEQAGASEDMAPETPVIDSGGGWYHEAAVDEARRSSRN